MPKKVARNPFFFFMREWKKQEENRGRTFPNGFRDVQADHECSELWRAMKPEEKRKYQLMAKQAKAELAEPMKLTTTGEFFDDIDSETKRLEEFESLMEEDIRNMINLAFQRGDLKELRFCFIHVNWFYTKQLNLTDFDYAPAEFAIGEFSIEYGMEHVYHEIINLKPECGYMREALERSSTTHKIPVNLPNGQDDFAVMYKNFKEFFNRNMINDKYSPIYTTTNNPTDAAAVRSFLKRMGGVEAVENFPIYSIELLFLHVRNTVVYPDVGIPLTVAQYEFGKNVFSYTSGLECEFHKTLNEGLEHCSLSLIQQWAFIFCDHSCNPLNVKMVPGVHLPSTSNVFPDAALVPAISNLKLNGANSDIADLPDVKSMSGVSEQYRIRQSERTYAEKEKLRQESKPVTVIDYSKVQEYNAQPSLVQQIGRPLRAANTKSYALLVSSEKDLPPDMSQDNFPTIGGGRGRAFKENTNQLKFKGGRGRGRAS